MLRCHDIAYEYLPISSTGTTCREPQSLWLFTFVEWTRFGDEVVSSFAVESRDCRLKRILRRVRALRAAAAYAKSARRFVFMKFAIDFDPYLDDPLIDHSPTSSGDK